MAVIDALWRYPVKSLQGTPVEELVIGPYGGTGDRTWAFADAGTGMVLSAKKVPDLLTMTAAWDGDAVVVTVPGDEPRGGLGAQRAASDWLGRAVVLVPADPHALPYVDEAPLSLLALADLASLAGAAPDQVWATRRFRANVVIEGLDAGDLAAAVGSHLAVGAATVAVTKRTERCTMVNAAQPGLVKDTGVLRATATLSELCVGVYADVVTGARLRPGDAVAGTFVAF